MPHPIILSEDEYNSSEDSDFAPGKNDPNHGDEASSDSDSDSENAFSKKRKTLSNTQSECLDTYDSGDEKIISESKHDLGSSKKARIQNVEKDGDEGRDCVKTRSQRSQEKNVTMKQDLDKSAVTIDVDAVWEAMKLGKPIPNSNKADTESYHSHLEDNLATDTSKHINMPLDLKMEACPQSKANDEGPESMIKIKRTYNFAGKFHTEEKVVARGSAEAKLYFKSLSDTSRANMVELASSNHNPKPKRPPKLARTSIFEPAAPKIPQRNDLFLGVRRVNSLVVSDILNDRKKLNTVEKSAIDWASFVDKEGIADELDAASKSKDAYKAREGFLARVEQKKEELSRKARGFIS